MRTAFERSALCALHESRADSDIQGLLHLLTTSGSEIIGFPLRNTSFSVGLLQAAELYEYTCTQGASYSASVNLPIDVLQPREPGEEVAKIFARALESHVNGPAAVGQGKHTSASPNLVKNGRSSHKRSVLAVLMTMKIRNNLLFLGGTFLSSQGLLHLSDASSKCGFGVRWANLSTNKLMF